MPRRRRYIEPNTCYEICFRARRSLPLVAYETMRLIIGSAIARTQRDDKVILCHDIWNGSHAHLIVVSKSPLGLVTFYGELQKRITDAIKRLLGITHLNIWEGYPMVAEICDLEAAKKRISYLYANPAQDNLVASIDHFPGYSSYKDFVGCRDRLDAKVSEEFPWIRLPSIERLSSNVLSPRQDRNIKDRLIMTNSGYHKLMRHPNAWMKCFGIDTDSEAAKINSDIIKVIFCKEQLAQQIRDKERKAIMGRQKLCSQPILKSHIPKKQGRKVFIIATVNRIRVKRIFARDLFDERCSECWVLYKAGDLSVRWPPGAFVPSLPPRNDTLVNG